MSKPVLSISRAAVVHDVIVALGAFLAVFGAGLGDATSGGKAALLGLAAAAASAAVKTAARALLPGTVDVSK